MRKGKAAMDTCDASFDFVEDIAQDKFHGNSCEKLRKSAKISEKSAKNGEKT